MTTLERKMVELLEELRDNYGVTEVKAEFEAEASRIQEVMRLRDVASRARMGMVLKIGGAEAITDMFEAQHIGTSLLVAPMVESPYALRKYLAALEKHFPAELREKMHFGVNIETKLACDNFPEMLKEKKIKLIDTITIGRVDLSASMGIDRFQINCDEIYEVTEKVYTLARKKEFKTTMGGGIGPEGAPFITKLVKKGLLDRFETRKIVFTLPTALKKIKDAIIKANEFEILWLQNKKNYYERIYHEDDERLTMLKKRIKE